MVCGVNDVCCFGNVWLSPIQSGLVLLLVGVLLLLAQRRSHRKLAVDLGGENHTDTTDSFTSHYQILHFLFTIGSKRLQALVMAVQSLLLVPLVVAQLGSYLISSTTYSHSWSSSLSCLLIICILMVAEFYIEAGVSQHEESSRIALTSSVTAFSTALVFSVTYKFLSTTDYPHSPSVGVVLATGLLLLSTVTLTRPVRPSHGLLVGYSTSGLPLYSSDHTPPSILDKLAPLLAKILENKDSRRIFYFLIINLVSC